MFYTARCGFSFLCSGLLTVCDTLRLLVIYMCCHHRGVDMACHQVLFLVGRADRIELHIVWRRQERLIQLLHIVYHGCNMVHHAVCTSCLFQSHQTFLALAYVIWRFGSGTPRACFVFKAIFWFGVDREPVSPVRAEGYALTAFLWGNIYISVLTDIVCLFISFKNNARSIGTFVRFGCL